MTMNLVELGLPDGPLYASEQNDPYVTKIGGRPCWPKALSTDEALRACLKCGHCGASLYLVLQMDCPWPGESGWDRIMYVFGCNSRICTEEHGAAAFRAFVYQTPAVAAPSAPATAAAPKANLWDSIMSDNPKPAPAVDHENDLMADEMGRLALDGAMDEEYPVGFPGISLHLVEELIQPEKARSSKKASEAVEEEIPAAFRAEAGGEESWAGENYEKASRPPGFDKVFEAFQRRVMSYPRQCVRFSPGASSKPLLFAIEQEEIRVSLCPRCQQKRRFELQLMPAILSLLPTGEDKYLGHIPQSQRNSHPLFGDGMEWGTVLVYTCGTCCKAPGFIEAAVYVQVEKI